VGLRTPAWLEAHCCPGTDSSEPGSSGTEVSVLVSTSGLKRVQVKLYRAADHSASTRLPPPKGLDGHALPARCERRELWRFIRGLVCGGPLSRPLFYGMCSVLARVGFYPCYRGDPHTCTAQEPAGRRSPASAPTARARNGGFYAAAASTGCQRSCSQRHFQIRVAVRRSGEPPGSGSRASCRSGDTHAGRPPGLTGASRPCRSIRSG